MFTNERDVSNYLGFNIKKHSYGNFELLQSHPVEKNFNHVGLTVSFRLKARDMLSGKPLLYEEESSIGRKCVCNYRAAVGMLSYIQ